MKHGGVRVFDLEFRSRSGNSFWPFLTRVFDGLQVVSLTSDSELAGILQRGHTESIPRIDSNHTSYVTQGITKGTRIAPRNVREAGHGDQVGHGFIGAPVCQLVLLANPVNVRKQGFSETTVICPPQGSQNH